MSTHVLQDIKPLVIKSLFESQKKRSIALRNSSINDRKKLLTRFEKFILANRERIGMAVHADFKKPITEVDLSEIYPVVSEIRHTVNHLREWAAPQKIDAPLTYLGTRSRVVVEPKGVCLIIAPWNYPFSLCFGPLISCLAAGNTAIIKPSEMTPHTSSLIKELISEFFEPDLVTVVEGGTEVSQELLALPFDHIFFTGSPAVGKVIMKAAAENLTSVTLELGGKSPTVIDETANISDAAKRIAFGKFLNNGQTCIAPDYVLIHEKVQSKFVDALKHEVTKMFGVNSRIDENSVSYARIVNQKHFKRISGLIEDAVNQGAKIEMGGLVNPETNFIHPMLLTNVSLGGRIMEEEIFGPVLPIIGYKGDDEVIKLINSKPKPLALYIFSNQKSFREKVLSSTSAGTVCINECVIQFTHANLPFGGVNNSGIGKSHGYYGFMEFSNQKPILKQMNRFSSTGMIHPPFTGKVRALANLMLKYF
jgi:aldehyde dehydrogenase (NAD+)